MRRRVFDMLVSGVGALLTIVLVVAGVLLLWGYSFVNNQVTSQLSEQKITFPAKDSPGLTALPATDRAAMEPYAGQLMTDGAQANTYANHFISVHLNEIGGGKTYSELSADALANPTNKALAAQVDTVFKGTMLRSSLLTAYAFWQIGQIALIAGIIALCAAFIMLILTLLGIRHLGHTSSEAELRAPEAHRVLPGHRI
jgi:hypothetical protein